MKNIEVIAHIKNGFNTKFGIPRQSGLAGGILSEIIFEDKFSDFNFIRGIENYEYLWLIWGFSENDGKYSPTVRPPRLGGNERVGVFATRSPFRPNNLGLSSVKLEKIENGILYISGADLMNNTPIYDIKPYITYSDCHINAHSSFADKYKDYRLNVIVPENIKIYFDDKFINDITEILSNDPRPAYQNDSDRIYGVEYCGYDIHFKVENNTLTVIEVVNL